MTKPINEGRRIEEKSFEIIGGLLKKKGIDLSGPRKAVITRVIHTTTDLGYAGDLVFSAGAIEAGLKAIRQGKNIVVDSTMVMAGINKSITACFKNKIICRIHDRDVIKKSGELNLTRAIVAMRKSQRENEGGIVAIGNAPTALFELCDLIKNANSKPALVVGIPVGFVGAAESKRVLRGLKIPYITNKSRKGGSTVAAAIVNALLILANKP
ncbi:MAG: precorrin-8X methylmutase [Candidatus Omnitrophota bacterium]|nr:precorrin-8X methylmutase [Candidatus Omnitrophota bacterium]